MITALLIDSDETFRFVCKLNFLKCVQSNVFDFESTKATLELIETISKIDLIVCRKKNGGENSASLLIDYLNKKRLGPSVVVIGKAEFNYSNYSCVSEDATWQEVIKKSGLLLNQEIDFESNKQTLKFTPVGINYFLHMTDMNIGCDIYIRVKKGDEFNYIKRFNDHDVLSREEIEKYKALGLEFFYINKNQFRAFVDFASNRLTRRLKTDSISPAERIALNQESHNLMAERIQTLGIDQHTVELVESSISSMKKALGEKNALAAYLNALNEDQFSYSYSHSYLCCLILHKVSPGFDWGTSKVKDRLTLIAQFHDISLSGDMVRYNSLEQIKAAGLDRYELELIYNHAQLSANIVSAFEFIPEEVTSVIREHHGSKNGKGLPESLSIAISPLSMMFIVVEDFVDEFLSYKNVPDIDQMKGILERLKLKYNKLTYEKTVKSLTKMVFSNNK